MTPIQELLELLSRCDALESQIAATARALVSCLDNGGKIYTCGNGGSAATALHLTQELVGRYKADRPALSSVCLNADAVLLSCLGNDFGFEAVFSRQVSALARPGDLVIGFTTSGNSPNVLAAFGAARAAGAGTVLVGGNAGGRAGGTCDFELIVPSTNMARIQEVHTLIIHTWLDWVDAHFCAR